MDFRNHKFWSIFLSLILVFTLGRAQNYSFEFYGNTFNFELDQGTSVAFGRELTESSIKSFYTDINKSKHQSILKALALYKDKHQLNDWLYYQLIRKTAQQIAPKAENYYRYTLYKWFFLSKTGYDARLALEGDKLLFYVKSEDDISDIPFYIIDGHQYVCLNIHDYPGIDLKNNKIYPVELALEEAKHVFSYKVTQMPDFKPEDYTIKNIQFRYRQKVYHFEIKLTPQVQTIFANYPVVDFKSYFNIPLSRETYSSLIPSLKTTLSGMSQKKGIDYLMRFTRNAFLYEDDELNFGKEKRLTPEQTLFSEYSDCDDRAALFFYLVKEIYNLPMIALLYPTHITMAVQFDKPVGKPIMYKGKKYYVCEPTPQAGDLKIGQVAAKYRNVGYEVVYAYEP
ncbi:hypothetical protein ACFSJU_00470 [Paradesertivirga mongoliensis]|uniref:Transglutaminase-like domain-containing protein n=1 Tax=Paradesertivirga mongoliensis TaxID=2100740 RepID=A0ABW4ZFY6_9SPHI|nr:hypothetical protein [Pedobacter mongoliensis]